MNGSAGRYPLEAARTLRQDAVEVAQRTLATALGGVEQAEGARARAADVRRQRAARVETERAREAARDGDGRSVAEMMTGQAWVKRLERERGEAETSVQEAERAVQEAERVVDGARAALGQARAEAEVVERHREGWESERKRERLAKEEAEAEEHSGCRR